MKSRGSSWVSCFILAKLALDFPCLLYADPPSIKEPIRVRTVQEAAISGELESLSLSHGMRLILDGEARQIETADIISVQRVRVASSNAKPTWPVLEQAEIGLELVNGDRIAGELGSSTDSISLSTQNWGTLTLPLERVSAILLSSADLPAYADSLRWFRRQKDESNDRVLLTNGDVVSGFLLGVSRAGLQLGVGDDTSTIPLRLAVAAHVIHPSAGPLKQPHAMISLVDGQRLTVVELDWKGDAIRGKAPSGEVVEPLVGQIDSIAFEGGRWEWVMLKPPAEAKHTAMLKMEWKHVVDHNVLGGPLRVAGNLFEKGIGVHSKSLLSFNLDGHYREFVTSFGIDDDSGAWANVQTIIRVDGQQRYEKSDVVAGTLYGPVRVDLTGGKSLELVVDFGKNGDIQDRLDWIEPILVK